MKQATSSATFSLEIAQRTLETAGYICDATFDIASPAGALMICEAINRLAKKHPRDSVCLYDQKFKCIQAAISLGCTWGWDGYEKGEVLYVTTLGCGTVSFHDPQKKLKLCREKRWSQGWSAVTRQKWALDALRMPDLRALLHEYTAAPRSESDLERIFQQKATKIVQENYIQEGRSISSGPWSEA